MDIHSHRELGKAKQSLCMCLTPTPLFSLTHVIYVSLFFNIKQWTARRRIVVKPRTAHLAGGLVIAGLKTVMCGILGELSSLRLSKSRSNGGNYSIPNDIPLLAPCSRILVSS